MPNILRTGQFDPESLDYKQRLDKRAKEILLRHYKKNLPKSYYSVDSKGKKYISPKKIASMGY